MFITEFAKKIRDDLLDRKASLDRELLEGAADDYISYREKVRARREIVQTIEMVVKLQNTFDPDAGDDDMLLTDEDDTE